MEFATTLETRVAPTTIFGHGGQPSNQPPTAIGTYQTSQGGQYNSISLEQTKTARTGHAYGDVLFKIVFFNLNELVLEGYSNIYEINIGDSVMAFVDFSEVKNKDTGVKQMRKVLKKLVLVSKGRPSDSLMYAKKFGGAQQQQNYQQPQQPTQYAPPPQQYAQPHQQQPQPPQPVAPQPQQPAAPPQTTTPQNLQPIQPVVPTPLV